MTHDEVAERLPWYLAGSLAVEEREKVEAHLERCEECRREREAARAAAQLFAAEHPETAELVDVAWERATPERARAIREHATTCAACREELALVERSRRLEESEEPEATGAEKPGREVDSVTPFSRHRRDAFPAPVWWTALAAAVALVAVGLAFNFYRSAERWRGERDELVARLESAAGASQAELDSTHRQLDDAEERLATLDQELERWRAPRTAVAIVELLPGGVLRGAPPPPAQVVEARPRTELVLLLSLERPGAFDRYAVHLLDAAGNELWSTSGVEPGASGALSLLVPADLLPEGEVRFAVEGEGGRGTRPVATYRLDVRPAAAP